MKALFALFLIAAVAPAYADVTVKTTDDQLNTRRGRKYGRPEKDDAVFANRFADLKSKHKKHVAQDDEEAKKELAQRFAAFKARKDKFHKDAAADHLDRANHKSKWSAKDLAQRVYDKVRSRGDKQVVDKPGVRRAQALADTRPIADVRSHFRNALLTKLNGSLRGATECNLCVQFMDQFLNELLQIILNGGVVGGCGALCNMINGSSIESTVCNLLCDAVGIDAFINLIEDADLDPVWMCEEVDACAKTTCTSNCAVIRTVDVGGTSFPAGATLNYTVIFGVLSAGVGVSTVQVTLTSNQKYDGEYVVGSGDIFIPQASEGFFQAVIPVVTANDDGNGGSDPFPTGTYNATVTFCEGTCGSNHTGSGEILASKDAGEITLR